MGSTSRNRGCIAKWNVTTKKAALLRGRRSILVKPFVHHLSNNRFFVAVKFPASKRQ